MFIIKVFGVCLIVVSSTIIGLLKSNSLTLRCKKISLLLDGVNSLYNYIDQGGYELKNALKNAFSKCEFLSFSEQKAPCNDNDLKVEKEVINEFFNSLGNSVKKIECDKINAFSLKLKTYLKDAENEASQKSKVYSTLGVCAGLIIAILLI